MSTGAETLHEPMLINTGDTTHPVSVSQAMLKGYGPDSELYTYSEFPEISIEELTDLRAKSYSDVFYAVTKKLIGNSIPDSVLRTTAETAYSPDKFNFDTDHNLRLTTLESGIHVVGLSDGPTGAFKDMAMQPFASWMSHLRAKSSDPATILLATTGDTGPAALDAFGGMDNTEIVAMLPRNGVSAFQRAQMAEMDGQDGIHVIEADGHFKKLNDMAMKVGERYDLGSVNSVNIARIIAQIPYHVASYLKAIDMESLQIGDPVDISIPSGNFGNALSAIIARKMGVPFRQIIVASNENNTLDTLISDGVFRLAPDVVTDSSAQDIQMPSNVWRYFMMLYGNDPKKVGEIYRRLEKSGEVVLSDIGDTDESFSNGVVSATIREAERHYTMQRVYGESGKQVLVDPHTANGLAAAERLRDRRDIFVPMLVPETAKPYKFNEAMWKVLGVVPPRPKRFMGLEERLAGTVLTRIADLSGLDAYLHDNTNAQLRR
jgi:threonine synthase